MKFKPGSKGEGGRKSFRDALLSCTGAAATLPVRAMNLGVAAQGRPAHAYRSVVGCTKAAQM